MQRARKPIGLADGQTPLVDVSSARVGGNVGTAELSELPAMNRNYFSAVALLPGVQFSPSNQMGNDTIVAGLRLNGDDVPASKYVIVISIIVGTYIVRRIVDAIAERTGWRPLGIVGTFIESFFVLATITAGADIASKIKFWVADRAFLGWIDSFKGWLSDLVAHLGINLPAVLSAIGSFIADHAWPGNQRELRNLVQVAELIVRSLEAEDWSRLGAPVFVRGQVRSYSRLMGLMTAPMMDALVDVGPVEPSRLVSRTHTPKAQWWAEQIGRRLVYIVLTLSLVIPVWVATRQHLSVGTEGVSALDTPVDRAAAAKEQAKTPRTVVASMAPVSAPAAAPAAEIVLRTKGQTWLEVTAVDGSMLDKTLLSAGVERRYAADQGSRMTIGNASAVELEDRGRTLDTSAHARANVARFEVSSDGSLVAAD